MSKVVQTHEQFMKIALNLAEKGRFSCKPNPMVGAVLVKNGKIIAKGFHKVKGGAHAEVEVLNGMTIKDCLGATMYVTLEPCVHTNKLTPPCVDLILKKGIKKIFVASKDLNPLVNGRGIAKLKAHGVDVTMGFLRKNAEQLNEVFLKSMSTPLPFIVLKIGMSLDRKIAIKNSKKIHYITSQKSLNKVHEMRAFYDAILVTSNTVINDNPKLDVRFFKGESQPFRVVIDRYLKTEFERKVYRDKNVVVFALNKADKAKIAQFKKVGVKVVQLNKFGFIKSVFFELKKMGINSVMVEAGSKFSAELVKARLVDKAVFFISPKMIDKKGVGFKLMGMSYLQNCSFSTCGEDILFECRR